MSDIAQRKIIRQLSSEKVKQSQQSLTKVSSQQKLSQKMRKAFNVSQSYKKVHCNRYKTQASRSQFKEPMPQQTIKCLQSYLKMKKVKVGKKFFTQDYKFCISPRSKEQIQEEILKSEHFIENIKKNKPILNSYTDNTTPYQSKAKQNQDILDAIGLQFPLIKAKKRQRILTQPSIINKNKKKEGLYSYLNRDFVSRNNPQLTHQNIVEYAKSPYNRQFQNLVRQKSRKFLKESVGHGHRYQNVYQIVEQVSKKAIQQQISQKRQGFKKDYKVRNSVPYFSFLSLTNKQKEGVLKRSFRQKSFALTKPV